eukprot:31237-Pelagococcus_subviridis.AAC.22
MSSTRAAFGHAALTRNENASSAMKRSKITTEGAVVARTSSKSAPRFGKISETPIPSASSASAWEFRFAHATKCTRQPLDLKSLTSAHVRTPAAEEDDSGQRNETNTTDFAGFSSSADADFDPSSTVASALAAAATSRAR